jgi:hypothetical protein
VRKLVLKDIKVNVSIVEEMIDKIDKIKELGSSRNNWMPKKWPNKFVPKKFKRWEKVLDLLKVIGKESCLKRLRNYKQR